jgi:hypothetical protein
MVIREIGIVTLGFFLMYFSIPLMVTLAWGLSVVLSLTGKEIWV